VMTVFRNDNKLKRKGGFISVLRSTDKGTTWSGEIPIERLGTIGVTDPDTGDPVRTGDIIPDIATDRRPGTDNVYVVWQDARFTGFQRDQIAFSKSTDGGLTWTPAVRINSQTSTQAFTASIEVDAAGNLGVTHYDSAAMIRAHHSWKLTCGSYAPQTAAPPGAKNVSPPAIRHAYSSDCPRILCWRLRGTRRERRDVQALLVGIPRNGDRHIR
jgi:hypothetical protein